MNSIKHAVTIIVTAHREGRLAHRTMRSLARAVSYADSMGVTTEIIVVMDRPDDKTKAYFAAHAGYYHLLKVVDFGDPGLSRNYGISVASGTYVGFLDADDLLGENWIFAAFNYLESCPNEVILHPEFQIYFEGRNNIWKQISSTSPEFKVLNLIDNNYWTVICFALKEVFTQYPYQGTISSDGFGDEDWHFNCETLAHGIEHHVVPKTACFIRVKRADSVLSNTIYQNRVIRPTQLFNQRYLRSLPGEVADDAQYSAGSRDPKIDFKQSFISYLTHKINYPDNLCYFVINRVVRGLYQLFPALKKNGSGGEAQEITGCPDWLLSEWRSIHGLEPQIFPQKSLLDGMQYYRIRESEIGRHYVNLARLYGENVSHVFIVPFLKIGGADLVTINYITALAENELAKSITVIATMNEDSPWAERLPKEVNFIDFGKHYAMLSSTEQEKLLSRLLLQEAPKVIHVMLSDLGFRIFVKYGNALKSVSNLFASTYCVDMSAEGQSFAYAFTYFPECFDNLSGVFSDNRSFLEYLKEVYAFEDDTLYVHYQPFEAALERRVPPPKSNGTGTLRILWASRLDRQKRPDILAAIAEACLGLPFRFHVYGTAVMDIDEYTPVLKRLDNVVCHGAYDGLSSLPVEDYDMFLYTSQWDGLPNVLLEAISLGLPIIAPNVGAVGELIYPGKTGFMIDRFDDVQGYVGCLRQIHEDPSELPMLVMNALQLISDRHSWARFTLELKKIPEYVVVS